MKKLLLGFSILALVPNIYANNFSVSNYSVDAYEEQIAKLQEEIQKHDLSVIKFNGEDYFVDSRSDVSKYAKELASSPKTRNQIFGDKWKSGFDKVDFVWNSKNSVNTSEFSYLALRNLERTMPKLSEEELEIRSIIEPLEVMAVELKIAEIEELEKSQHNLTGYLDIRLPENTSRISKVQAFFESGNKNDIKAIFGKNYKDEMIDPIDLVYNNTTEATENYIRILEYYIDLHQAE
jgi:hypothetical protein